MPQFCYEMTKTLSSLLATTIEQESVINHIVFWLAIFVELLQNICYFGAVQRSPREGFANVTLFASLPITAKSVAIRTGSGFFTTAVAISKFNQAFFQTFQLFFATPSVKSRGSGGGMLCAICVFPILFTVKKSLSVSSVCLNFQHRSFYDR